MNILLLGGTGFVGEYLVKKLSQREGVKIFIVGKDIAHLENDRDNVELIQLDLTEKNEKFEKLVDSADIAVIMTQPNEKVIDNFISVIGPGSRLKKIVYLSSALVYDNFEGNQDETSLLNPMTDYERGKCEEEQKLEKFAGNFGLKLCVARLSNVYGDVKNRGLINYVFLALLNEGELKINGKGDSVRDYIFVEDVAAYLDFLIFWNQKRKKEVLNLCTGEGYSVLDAVRAIEKATGKKIEKKFGPVVSEKKMVVGDNKKIAELSGKLPKYDLVAGLERTYKNYLDNK